MYKAGPLKMTEVFLMTDNSVAEAAFHKGTSSNKCLFELIVRLRILEMKSESRFWIIHVAGTRMMEQGTDGLSRGDLREGVMQGKQMMSFMPLHRSALERSLKLEQWIRSWAGEDLAFLSPEDWFEKGHDISGGTKNGDGIWLPNYAKGTYIWAPAPAAGAVAVEELRHARHKRKDSTHIFVVPRLFATEWRKQLYRVSDVVLELPFIDNVWPSNFHEPLVVGFCFPFLSCKPWQLRGTPAFLGLGRYLCRLWKDEEVAWWNILQQLFNATRRMGTLSECVVWEVLQSIGKFAVFCGFSHE